MTIREVKPPAYSLSCDFCDTAAVAGARVPHTWMKIRFTRNGTELMLDMCPSCRMHMAKQLFSDARIAEFSPHVAELFNGE